MRLLVIFSMLLAELVVAAPLLAQQNDNSQTTTCSFDDEKQISVQYNAVSASDKLPNGKVWAPNGSPLLLFTQTPVTLGNTEIPVGAYSMFVIPGKENWTLIVNKNVTPGSKYDESQDLARVQMDIGQLGNPEKQLSVVFGHSGPKQCSMRIYYGKIGTWADFHEK